MITASQAFMNKVANGEVPSMRMQFIPASGEPFYLSDGDFWAESISFSEATSQSGTFTVGAAVIGEFSFTLNNFGGTLTDEIFAGAKVIPSVYYDINGTPEYLPKGVYYVASHKTNGNLIRVKAYDGMKLLDENKTTITYPTTVQAIVNAICTASGITLATQTIPNGTYSISLAPEADMTDRQLLSAVCEITGNFARMDENGKLYVGWYDFSNPVTIANTFDGKDLWTLPITLTGVRVNVYSGDNTYFYGTDDNVVTVSNNPLVYAGNGQEICNMLGARITGATFRPGSLPILSNPCLQSGDVLEITDNITHDTYLLPITELTYTKGLTETVSCSFENTEDADLRPTIEGLLKKSIDEASAIATQASELASETEQHFWFTSGTGTEAGAHIADQAKTDFEQNPTGGNTLIRSDGVQIRNGLDAIATFGSPSQIGKDAENHLVISSSSLEMFGPGTEGSYAFIGDLRGSDGRADISENFFGDGDETQFQVSFNVASVTSVKINNTATTAYTRSGRTFMFNSAPSASAEIEINYRTISANAKAYTLGRRGNGSIGGMSVAENSDCVASGTYSHAEGLATDATGLKSHTEGEATISNGESSHAEGFLSRSNGKYSHAGGYSGTAYGTGSFAHGRATQAVGDYSAAFGRFTEARGTSQFVVGENNKPDTSNKYAFIVGNGSGSKSNAFAVGWDGSIEAALFQIVEKTYAYTNLAVGAGLSISADDFGVSVPSGYTAAAVLMCNSGSAANCSVTFFNGAATGTNPMMRVVNTSSAARSYTARIRILYVRSTAITS